MAEVAGTAEGLGRPGRAEIVTESRATGRFVTEARLGRVRDEDAGNVTSA